MPDLAAATVERARQGDAEAFRELVEGHSHQVFRIAYRITGDGATAEDAVQETFLRAYRRLDGFDARAKFSSWLHRIAVNAAIDLVRKQRRHRSGHPLSAEGETSEPEPPSAEPGPDRRLLAREAGQVAEAALARLSPLERAAFALRHFEGQSIEEISLALGTRKGATKQAVFRAVKKLRKALRPLVVSYEPTEG